MSATIESGNATRKSSRGARPRQTLNLRLIGWSLGALALASPAVYFWHARQIDLGAAALLSRAEEQETAEEWSKASESLHRYLRLRPADAEARGKLAKDYANAATSLPEKSRAIELYATAIGEAPDNAELIRGQMLLFLETNDFTEALKRADTLLARAPQDPAGLRGRALGLLARWRFKSEGSAEAMVEAMKLAIAKNPEDALLATELARVYRVERLKELDAPRREALADETMQRLIDGSSNKTEALLARYTFRKEFGLDGADDDLDHAIAADADHKNLTVRLTAAARALDRRDWTHATELFQQVIEIKPGEPRGHLGLGLAREASGDEAGAVEAWQRGLERADPNDLIMQLRVASAQVRLQQLDQAVATLDKLEQQVERLLGPQKVESLADIYAVRADIALAKKDYRAAIPALHETLRLRRGGLQSPQSVAVRARAEQQLGGCFGALRQWDEAASAYQRAAELQPGRPAARFLAGGAWEAAGRLDEAARQYEDGLAIEQTAPALTALAHTRFRQQLVLPKDKRDWRDFSDALAKAQEKSPADTSLKLLGAEFEIEQGRAELALDALRKAEAEALTRPDLTRRLVFGYQRCQRPEEADRVTAALRKAGGASLANLLLAADLLSARGQSLEAAALLRKEIAHLPEEDQPRAKYGLALIEVASGKQPAAVQVLKELTAADADALEAFELLAELSLDAGDLSQVQSCADAIKKIEGRDGTYWRFYQAQRLLRESAAAKQKPAARKLLEEARALADEIERRRPNWALAHVLKARLNQSPLRPDNDAAVQAYFHAIRFGENRLRIYEELVLLLYQQNRLVEAAAYLERLRAADSLSPVLNTMSMVVDARQGNLTRAIETARRDVKLKPDDALAHLRLGQLLAQPSGAEAAPSAFLSEAEAELRRAADLLPSDARPWLALLTFYVQTKQAKSGESLLKEIEQGENIAAAQKPFVLAQGYSLIQKPDQAADFYRQAVAASPDDLAVQVQAARFFFDSDKAQAERCLNQARTLAPDDADVRRLLAALRATQSLTDEDLEGIFSLLDGAESGDTAEPTDQRLKAVLLLRRGGTQSRQRAQKLLETLVGGGHDSAPIDRLLLARLYEARGAAGLTAAREQLEALINREKPQPDHLAIYVDHLLRNDQADQAAAALDQLSELEPAANHFRTVSLRARWLSAVHRPAEIAPLVEAYEKANLSKLGKPEQATALRDIANLYSLVELIPAADAAYRRALEADPASYVSYAMWLVRRDRTGDAIQLCSRAAEADAGPRPAMTLCTVLALGQPSADERRAAEATIDKSLEAHSEDPRLLFSAATMQLMQGQTERAIALLRQVLEISPNNLQAMNNLAMLLAEQPGGQKEALTFVDRAIALKGLDPELLDTKGWILLRQKQPKEAEAMFDEALAVPPGDPRHRLHLALAYHAQGKLKEARQTLVRARDNKLASAKLSPSEQTVLAELEAALK